MDNQQFQAMINKAHIAIVNTVTGGHWNYSKAMQDEFNNTDFSGIDNTKTPLDDPWYSDFQIEVHPRNGDFIETLINALHGDGGCFTDINLKAIDTDRNIYWCFDDDIHLLIFLAMDEDVALYNFRHRIESYK